MANPIDVLGDADPRALRGRGHGGAGRRDGGRHRRSADAASHDRPVGDRPGDRPLLPRREAAAGFVSGRAGGDAGAAGIGPRRRAGISGAGAGRRGPEGHVRLRPVAAACRRGSWPASRQPPPRRARVAPLPSAGELFVNEAAAKEIMRAYRFNVPEGAIAASAAEAVEAALKIGLPVAMKIVSPDMSTSRTWAA